MANGGGPSDCSCGPDGDAEGLLKSPTLVEKVAVFLGTFDPLHRGHIGAAQAALEAGCGEVVFVPTAVSTAQSQKPRASHRSHRLRLASMALKDQRGLNLLLSPPAVSREGWSLRPLREQVSLLYSGSEVGELHGTDKFVEYPPREHPSYFDGQLLYLVSRPGGDAVDEVSFEGVEARPLRLPSVSPCSSSEIQRGVREGVEVEDLLGKGLVCREQYDYISGHGLYRS
eukprot:Hpha_TRINITY_DN12517_c0_g1::TRINITY_DN12517_c0_g1_i1::g.50909::m.50909/K00969/nadD; nicotinate-nucleotide adenylyltransferase